MSWHSYVMVDIAAVIVIVIVIGICTLIHVVSRSSPGCCAEPSCSTPHMHRIQIFLASISIKVTFSKVFHSATEHMLNGAYPAHSITITIK